MAFQSTVSLQQGFGVPGELFTDAPYIALPYTIVSTGHPEYNIIGATCCTITSEGICEAGAGGARGFAGFLVDPKDQALFGAGGVPLNPTLTVNNNSIVECLTMGTIIVTLPAAANIGDYVIFDDTTGAISTIAPTDPLPTGKTFANAQVTYYTQGVSGSALAVITVNPTYIIPQPL
jgi:hypothetical protein